MENIRESLEKKKKELEEKAKKKRRGGATYEWQDRAVEIAKALDIKPNPSWFRFFKYCPHGVIQSTYSYMSDIVLDPSKGTKEKMFYWVAGQIRKNGRVIPSWEKLSMNNK